MSKQAFVHPEPMDPRDMPTLLRIRGLKAVPGEDEVFELSGVKPRRIDHDMLARALGHEPREDDELDDKVLATVWRFDMVRVLTERIVI
jgi:hypothetical protein